MRVKKSTRKPLKSAIKSVIIIIARSIYYDLGQTQFVKPQ